MKKGQKVYELSLGKGSISEFTVEEVRGNGLIVLTGNFPGKYVLCNTTWLFENRMDAEEILGEYELELVWDKECPIKGIM